MTTGRPRSNRRSSGEALGDGWAVTGGSGYGGGPECLRCVREHGVVRWSWGWADWVEGWDYKWVGIAVPAA